MKKILCFGLIIGASILKAQTLSDAVRMTENEQFESANKIFEKLTSAEPNNGNYYYYYGENYFQNDQLDKAKPLFQKGVNVNPNNALNYVGLGKVAYVQANTADANSNFFKAKTISQSKNATVLMEIAEVYITSDVKNISEAIKLLQQAIALEPKNPEIFTLLGDAYLEQNDGNQAIANYEKALDLDKKFTKAILREGKLYSRAKNYNVALEYYNKAIGIDSSFAPAFRERAELRFRAGQADRASKDYEKYLKLNDNLSAKTRYAEFLFIAKDYKKTIDVINDIQKTDTSYINLYRLLGYAYYETGKYPEGMVNMDKFFKKANATSKKLLSSDYEYLGKNQMKAGKDSLGTGSLLKAIQMDSTKTDLYGDIASGCLKQKNFACAIENYEKKIAVSKNKTGGVNDYYGLGRAYYYSKDYVKADTAFAQVIRMQPALSIGYLWSALSNIQLDTDSKKGLANPFFEKFVETVAPADVEKNKKDLILAYEYLGYYDQFIVKNYPKAKDYWTRLKGIDPENKKASKALTDPNLK